MAKFIIIDQSLKDLQGHHFEYDISVGEAANRLGYETVIISHKNFPVELHPRNIIIIPVFKTDWVGNELSRNEILRFLLKYLAPLSSPRAIVENTKKRILIFLKDYYNYLASTKPQILDIIEISAILELRTAIKSDVKKLLTPIGIVLGFIWNLLPNKVFVWFLRRLIAISRKIFGILFIQTKKTLKVLLGLGQFKFGETLFKTLREVGLNSKDHVFIPNLGVGQLYEVLYLLKESNFQELPHFHILLRRDCNEPMFDLASLKICLNRFYDFKLFPKLVTFYTDTDELTHQHNSLSPIPFVTAPIPFRHEKLKGESKPHDLIKPINIVYLGDARTEKGYQYLPYLVDNLWFSHIRTKKIRFTIQSNYNLAGGEAGIPEARMSLEQYPSEQVCLLKEALSPDNYYEVLAEADIVVIPYQADRYAVRSSGVLVEALASGIPVVVPANTWMAKQVNKFRASIYSSPMELTDAVIRLLANFETTSTAADSYKQEWREKHSPDALVNCLVNRNSLSNSQALQKIPSILFMIDADSIIEKVGAGQVASNQLEYLTRCGYRVYGVFFFRNPKIQGKLYDTRVDLVKHILKDFNFVDIWLLKMKFPNFLSFRQINLYINAQSTNKLSLDLDLAGRSYFDIPLSLIQFIETNSIDIVFLNYITNWSLVEKLGLNKFPLICEIHDIQAHQYALSNNRQIDLHEFKKECKLLDKCDVLLSNNPKETEKIREYTTKLKFFHIPYIGRLKPPKISNISNCMDLVDVLKLSGSQRSEDIEQNYRLSNEDSLDLLFISSYHSPNIYSLKWFFNEVYMPYLSAKKINLLIAGNIMCCGDLKEINSPNIFIAGQVETLVPLYAATKLVVLPMKAGAGFNIKTIEALSMGKPTVATSVALRGINYDRNDFLVFDTPDAFARRIIELLDNPQARLEQAQQGIKLVKAQHSQARFDEAMNAAFEHLIGNKALTPNPSELLDWNKSLVEWTPEIAERLKLINKFVCRNDFGREPFLFDLYNEMYRKVPCDTSRSSVNLLNESDDSINSSLTSNHIICESNQQLKCICIIVPQEIRFYSPTVKLLADMLVKAGFRVDIFCIDFGNADEIEQAHMFQVVTYKSFWNENDNFLASNVDFLSRCFMQIGKYDAYIGVHDIGVVAAHFLATKIFKKPWIAYMLEIFQDGWIFRDYVASLFGKADAFIDVDKGRLNIRRQHLNFTNINFVINNTSPKDELGEINKKSAVIEPRSNVNLWYHGTISSYHGIKEIIEGFCRSKADISLHLTGPIDISKEKEEILALIKAVNKPIYLHPPVSRSAVLENAMKYADIAICFYPYSDSSPTEYFNRLYANPAKVFDYMGLGIPTIASDNLSLVEYVQNEGWGICVPPEDPDAVAEAIDLFANNYELRKKMSNKARDLFASKYNLDSVAEPFIDWLVKLLN